MISLSRGLTQLSSAKHDDDGTGCKQSDALRLIVWGGIWLRR